MSACSRKMARSTTWSMVVGAAAGLGAGMMAAGCGALCGAADSAGAGFNDCCADGIGASDDGTGAVVCWAIALNAISREAVIIHFEVRITQILSLVLVRQLENDMHNRRRIYRLIEMLGRFESHLVGGRDRSLVQSMTQAPHHAIHMQLPVRREQYFQ
jgi:hypothetical protein